MNTVVQVLHTVYLWMCLLITFVYSNWWLKSEVLLFGILENKCLFSIGLDQKTIWYKHWKQLMSHEPSLTVVSICPLQRFGKWSTIRLLVICCIAGSLYLQHYEITVRANTITLPQYPTTNHANGPWNAQLAQCMFFWLLQFVVVKSIKRKFPLCVFHWNQHELCCTKLIFPYIFNWMT